MPRSKCTAKVPRLFKPTADKQFGFDDALPSEVVDALLSIPSDPERHDAHGGNLAKRRKTTQGQPEDPVGVKRCNISFQRAINGYHVTNCVSVKSDIGPYVIFRFDGHRLGFRSRNNSTRLPGLFVLIRNGDAGPETETVFKFMSQTPSQSAHGMLWTNIDARFEIAQGMLTCTLKFSMMWNQTPSPYYSMRNTHERKESQEIIDAFFPHAAVHSSAWSPMDFYEAAYVPPKEDPDAASIEIPALEATLFPYQKRTVKWLLHREGFSWTSSGPKQISDKAVQTGFDTFRDAQDADGNTIYISDVFHVVSRSKASYYLADRAVKGGILAEEMGLGKTLEIISLILLNRRQDMKRDAHSHDHQTDDDDGLLKTEATLIVTPVSLQQQWMTEITRHAPSLRVITYEGCRKVEDEQDEIRAVTELASHDVVITTYSVLTKELHFAVNPPERSRRFQRVYRRKKSPLVQISWWRVCLDEAQMIESGVTKAASVARNIPRINAWGITGTPVKDDVQDLFGLLLFLRYQPYCSASQVWRALIRLHKPLFQKLFQSLALRHTKALVRDEILLPRQKRYVISMLFSAVEEQHYQTLFQEMAEDCDVSLTGAPMVDDWNPENYETKMRMWLVRLRQTALHPEVGTYSRRLLGYNKEKPMRTIEEVLNAMLEQSEAAIRMDERAYLSMKLTRGQLFENGPKVKEALAIWDEVRDETAKLVQDAREKLASDIEKTKSNGKKGFVEPLPQQGDNALGDSGSDSEMEVADARGKASDLQRRLRSALELHHKAVFFCANAKFQIRDNAEMTEPDSEEFHRLKKLEDADYEEAKVLRREILQESHRKANLHMTRITKKAVNQLFVEIPELTIKTEKGIESGSIVDKLELLYGELNEQANVMDEWREQVVQLLLRPLLDEEDNVETTGEELLDSAKFQDDLMVYVQALRSVIADRQDVMSGQTNELVKHETETSIKLAQNGGGPAPEKMLQLLQVREQMKPRRSQMSMRGAVAELRGLQARLSRDATLSSREAIEHSIVSNHLKRTQMLLVEQSKAVAVLESEIDGFKDAMNARLEYYRQLQAVSDAVVPYEGEKTAEVEARTAKLEQESRKKLLSSEAKHRYLTNLKDTGDWGQSGKSSKPRMCAICLGPFVMGVLTVCGHQFCKQCMMMWYKSHRNCPVCKKQLKPEQLHDVVIKPQQLQILSEEDTAAKHLERQGKCQQDGQGFASRKDVIYHEFNADKLAAIKNIELDGPSFTTKVDTLVRHLFWLRESDPGAKSIVFSQYRDFLAVLRSAFGRFGIGFASIDDVQGTARFQTDSAVECFLLHARAHASGLNLVNASHVFLCEPLLHTALELQAIARVDRIGQQHETTVWLYVVSGTVEESIYNLSVRRRMEHMGRAAEAATNGSDGENAKKRVNAAKGKSESTATSEPPPPLLLQDASIEAANTLELEHAALSKLMSKDRTAGEMVDKGDLWECLFGSVQGEEGAAAAYDGNTRLQNGAILSHSAVETEDYGRNVRELAGRQGLDETQSRVVMQGRR